MVDWGGFLQYDTLKVVRIRDRRLGVLYYSLIALVLCYVIGYQILYRNEHFQRFDVQGMGRVGIQQPTFKMCNPNDQGCFSDYKALTDLPYCKAYTGPDPAPNRYECMYADQHTLSPHGMLEGKMLIPTRIDKHYETKDCVPTAENGWTCRNEYTPAHHSNMSTENVFVADIERYTLLFTHTYYRGLERGNSLSTPGEYRVCPTPEEEGADGADGADKAGLGLGKSAADAAVLMNGKTECAAGWKYKSIDCVNDACQFVAGYKQKSCGDEAKTFLQAWKGAKSTPAANKTGAGFASRKLRPTVPLFMQEDEPVEEEPVRPGYNAAAEKGVVAIPPGDVFPIADLLKIAGVSLDGGKQDGQYNMDCEPYREAGVLVEVEASYQNLEPFWSSFRDNSKHISYTYNIRTRPVGEIKSEQFSSMQPLDFPNTRIIENRHGIYVHVKVAGQFGEFSIVYLLVMLTTSLALLAVATKIVDFLAIYVLADKDKYSEWKYQVTEEVRNDAPLVAGL